MDIQSDGEHPPEGDDRAHVDAVFAVGEGGRLQLGEGMQPVVQAVQPGCRLLELGVAPEEHGHVRIDPSGSIIGSVCRPVTFAMLRR